MQAKNSVFIASSIDGYIADENGGIDWLQAVPIPENIDMGYNKFMENVDALVMGRKSFETILGFDIEWPYNKPVFVLSNTLAELPEKLKGKAFIVSGAIQEILAYIHLKGYLRLYIDGGATIQSFLKEGLIDELIITTIPVLLGGGVPLFSSLAGKLEFELVESKVYLNQVVQNHFRKKLQKNIGNQSGA